MNLDTYCPIPFSEMFIRVDGSVYICCDTWEVVGNIREQSLNDIFNSAYLNEIRERISSGGRPNICNKCWVREDTIGDSYRSSHNQDGSINVLSGGKYKTAVDFAKNASTRIRKVKVDFSNACNMKCPMCNLDRSTGWLKEHKDVVDIHPDLIPITKEKYQEVTDQIPISFIDDNWEHFINSNLIDLSGGEPFYMPQVKYLLDRLVEERYNGVLKIVTNASLIEPFVDQLKKVNTTLVISCDGYGDLYPIARPSVGKTITWQMFESNIKILRQNKIRHSFCYVPQLMNIHNIDDWLDWTYAHYPRTGRLGLPLYKPNHLRIEHYPDMDYKMKLAERLQKRDWGNFDPHNGSALIKQLKMPAKQKEYDRFLTYMARLDKLRNTNFMAIWAENT